jgi:intein-encoded DNA endonuclease-like protein
MKQRDNLLYAINIKSCIVLTDVKGKFQLNRAQHSLKMNVSYIIQDLPIVSLCKFWFTVIGVTSSVSNRTIFSERDDTIF